jgi:HSP20 family protein
MQRRSLPDPFPSIPLREMIDQLFVDAVLPARRWLTSRSDGVLTPPVNVYETATDLMVVMPLPGMSPNDIEVDLLGTQLTVRTHARRDIPHATAGSQGGSTDATPTVHTADSKPRHNPGADPENGHRYYLHEFQIGPYERTIELPRPVDADRVQTSYEHGLLSLRFAFREADQPRRISLQSS